MKKWDVFERGVVLRVSRGLYLTLALVIALGLVVSLVVLFYSVSPTMKGAMPGKPAPPVPPNISMAEINQALADKEKIKTIKSLQKKRPAKKVTAVSSEDMSPEAQKIAEMKQQIHDTYFAADGFPWDSIYGRTCSRRWGSRCMSWRTKVIKSGVGNLIDRGIKDLNPAQSTELLQALLDLLPMAPENDNSRYLAARAIVDISRAFKMPPPTVYAEIATILRGGVAQSDQQQLIPPSDENKDLLFEVLYKVKKGDSKIAALTEYLRQWNQLAALFPAAEQAESMAIIWSEVKYRHLEQVPATLASIIQTVQSLDEQNRQAGLTIYTRLMKDKMRSAQRQYDQEMNNYNRAVNIREAKYAQKKVKKATFTFSALYGVASAIGGIALIGLLLGLLGIERNTRTLEQLLKMQLGSNQGTQQTMEPVEKIVGGGPKAEGGQFNNQN